MSLPITIAKRVGRTLLLLLFAAGGTILLVRFAPGFFSDTREMDAKYAQAAQAEIQEENSQQQSVELIAIHEVRSWLSGDFGLSRQYHVGCAIDWRACAGLGFTSSEGHLSWLAAGDLRCVAYKRSAKGRSTVAIAIHTSSGGSHGGHGDCLHPG